jgi:hypothetical protein
MSIRFTIDGIEFVTDSAKEAADLKRLLTPPQARAGGPVIFRVPDVDAKATWRFTSEPAQSAPTAAPEANEQSLVLARRFLEAILEHSAEGADTNVIGQALGTSGKGIGAKTLPVKNVLRLHGVDPDQVFLNPRINGERVWKPGPAFQAALEALKVGVARLL